MEQYLQVEKFRFGDRLTWEYQVEPEVRSIQIPKLFIHPLVENSMKYAVETTRRRFTSSYALRKAATAVSYLSPTTAPASIRRPWSGSRNPLKIRIR